MSFSTQTTFSEGVTGIDSNSTRILIFFLVMCIILADKFQQGNMKAWEFAHQQFQEDVVWDYLFPHCLISIL